METPTSGAVKGSAVFIGLLIEPIEPDNGRVVVLGGGGSDEAVIQTSEEQRSGDADQYHDDEVADRYLELFTAKGGTDERTACYHEADEEAGAGATGLGSAGGPAGRPTRLCVSLPQPRPAAIARASIIDGSIDSPSTLPTTIPRSDSPTR